MLIYKKYYFDAAHFMPDFKKNHKYGKVHGHSYEVTIAIDGNLDKKNDWVINFDNLDSLVKPLLKIIDHNVLNEIEGLEKPTSENLAIWFWSKLEKKIKFLKSIEINRPRIGGCVYYGK